jgi:cysteine desulfurase
MHSTQFTRARSYLDNNATSPIDPEALATVVSVLQNGCGNASSPHSDGRRAAELILQARGQVARLFGAAHDSEIVFTSGGTESNNSALHSALAMQSGRNEIVVSAIEHASVLATCAALEQSGRAVVRRIPVDSEGRIDEAAFRAALNERTAIASVQWANNETGVLQPVDELSRIAHKAGALFHSDAVQTAGRIVLDVQSTAIDFLSVSAHKLHGPQGVGALYVRKGTPFAPLIRGGRQERGRRAGSENVAGIAGFGKAAELAIDRMPIASQCMRALRDRLENRVLEIVPTARVLSSGSPRLVNTSCIAFAEVEGDDLVTLLDRRGVSASSGAACSSGAMEPSHVVRAMKVPFSHIRGAVRFSLSRMSSVADVDRACAALASSLDELGACAHSREAVYG